MKEQFPSTSFIGKDNYRFSQITSTNNYARELIANDEPVHGTVILADQQTAGRGQSDRQWVSQAGKNLLTTIILHQQKPDALLPFYLNKLIALSIAQTVSSLTSAEARIKWPNDILLESEKVCGILIENILQRQSQYSMIGIGLNVNQLIFPKELKHATSMQLVTGLEYEILPLAEQLYFNIEKNYTLLERTAYKQIDEMYHQYLFKLNQPQLFVIDNTQVEGVIRGVNNHGQLQVELDGRIRLFRNQELSFVL